MFPRQWPVKILLIHSNNPYLGKEELKIVADCALLARKGFHEEYTNGNPVFIGCPLLENPDLLLNKLRIILGYSKAKKIEVYSMEVPCCQALHLMIKRLLNELNIDDKEVEHYIVRVFTGNVEKWKPGVIDESMIELERIAHGHGGHQH